MRKGFSLIELLVVISIIGVLIAVGTASYLTAQKQVRDTRRKTDLMEIRQALETYRSENGTYPFANGTTMTTTNSSFQTTFETDYIQVIPEDPTLSKGNNYNYIQPTSTTYFLCAQLEITPTVSAPNCSAYACGTIAGNCNYEVANP